MYNILHVYPQLNCGGTEMVIYNLIKFSDRNRFNYDILVQRTGSNEQIFRELGCTIHVVPFNRVDEYKHALDVFFAAHHYIAVHTHMHEEIPYVLQSAKRYNVTHRIAHSHNARHDIPLFLWPLRIFKHHKYERYATDMFGCSRMALKWLFPLKWKQGKVIYNGIDLDKFRFNKQKREEIRKAYGILDGTCVYVNVGRCTDQKNQKFILQLAEELKNANNLFIIIGDGPLYDNLVKQKDECHLTNVMLLGKRDDVADWLCAADVFLFPSIYEGLGIVAIEAETSGLQVLATDSLPEEVDMHLGNFVPLAVNDKQKWLTAMSVPMIPLGKRTEISDAAFRSHYNIREVSNTVETIYQQ